MTRRTCASAVLLGGVLFAAAPPLAAQTAPAPAPSSQPTVTDPARRVEADAIDALIAKGDVVVLDVREPAELTETGTVKGAIHIPLGQLEARLGELPKDKVILTACRSGGRASRAMALLEAKGFKTAGFCGLQQYKGARVFPGAKS